MSKLDGNKRWQSSKMLLTEHQEQYDARRNKPASGRATTAELTMIRDVIMYPHLLTLCDRALEDVGRSSNVFKRHFAKYLQLIIAAISKDLYALRKNLRQLNIKVAEDETYEGILYYRYYCRGYEDRFGITRETLRAEISVRLTQYADDILTVPKKSEP